MGMVREGQGLRTGWAGASSQTDNTSACAEQ